MTTRIEVDRELYEWAQSRSDLEPEELDERFPQLRAWLAGSAAPTVRQLEKFAAATRTPVGFFFLDSPPAEDIPVTDYRTLADSGVARPSPDLLDTLYIAERRQEWFRQYSMQAGLEPVQIVGSATTESPIEATARDIREALEFQVDERPGTWAGALRDLRINAERLGVLVMVSGIVGTNTRRRLDPEEFRGFALVDSYAPVVFVNGSDTRAAQIFTLLHELAHVWLGESALDDAHPASRPSEAIERWCNRIAAETLVPGGELRRAIRSDLPISDQLESLAGRFKSSTLVVLRRVFDADLLNWSEFRNLYEAELERVLGFVDQRSSDGGDFYKTQPVRTSARFARALLSETLSGRTSFSTAMRLLGIRKATTLSELAKTLGVT